MVRRGQIRSLRVCGLPEEPLRNACVASMSVADNMAFRNFDQPPIARGPWISSRFIAEQAERWIRQFNVKSRGALAPGACFSMAEVTMLVVGRTVYERPFGLFQRPEPCLSIGPPAGVPMPVLEALHEQLP